MKNLLCTVVVVVVGTEQAVAEVAVSLWKPGLVGAHERGTVNAAARVLTHELTMQLDDFVRRKTASTQ